MDIDLTGANTVPGMQIVQDREFIGATAKDPVSARRAIASLRATWDEPAVTLENVESHLRSHPIAGRGWERPVDHAEDDVERALEVAAARVDASYTTAYIAHVPLETRAAVAEWDPGRI